MKQNNLLGNEKISKLLIKLATPAIIGMLINAIYNIVDTIFVGKLGTKAIGAASITYPLFMLIAAIGLMYGVGAGSYISRLLGVNDHNKVNIIGSTTLFLGIISGIILSIITYLNLDFILNLLGSTDSIMDYAKDYSEILLIGATFTIINMCFNNILRAEGNAKISMIALAIGALLNIILDPIFIFSLNMGIKGAAIATVISQFTSTIILFYIFISGKTLTQISFKYIKFNYVDIMEIYKIGIPTFFTQTLMSLSMGLLNGAAKPYGDTAIAAIGITNRVFSIGFMILFGFAQGFQPVAGYNYSSKNYSRLKLALKTSLQWSTIFCIVVAILQIIFAENIIGLFSNDEKVIKIGSIALKAISLMFPFFGYQVIYTTLFQSLGKALESTILSLSRQGIFFIPMIFILPHYFNLAGVIITQPVADLFTLLLTFYFSKKIHNKIAVQKSKIDLKYQ